MSDDQTWWWDIYLEYDELSRCPDVGPNLHPLDLPPDHAENEEHQEDGVDDEGELDHPLRDPGHVLQGGRLQRVIRWGGEGTGDKEGK